MKRSITTTLSIIVILIMSCLVACGAKDPLLDIYDAVVVASGESTADCERDDLTDTMVTQDVCNVQAAVNDHPGGKILLRGTFHFAALDDNGNIEQRSDGTVFITNDIEIYGEKENGEYKTKIIGGYYSFSVGLEPQHWSYMFSDLMNTKSRSGVPVVATIQDIEFENPYMAAVTVWATTGASITGNKISDGRAQATETFFGEGNHGSGLGILVAPVGTFAGEYPELITGAVAISDNQIDGKYRIAESGDPWGAKSFGTSTRGIAQAGIWVGGFEADITISNNSVRNTGFIGIGVGGNNGTTLVSGNDVSIEYSDPEILPEGATGIQAWGYYMMDGYETSAYELTNNTVRVGGPGLYDVGINVDDTVQPAIIQNNSVESIAGSEVGILLRNISNSTTSENELSGTCEYGIALEGYPDWETLEDDNLIEMNDVSALDASEADYYLGEDVTNTTLKVGQDDSVIDESGNATNTITY